MAVSSVKKSGDLQAGIKSSRTVDIKKADDELQIVWGEVYIPDLPDSHGHFMTADEVRKMAYRTVAGAFQGQETFLGTDVQHANQKEACVVVETFVARKDDDTFIPDSWVVGLHIADKGIWAKVKNGELNGFSMQASVMLRSAELEVDIPDVVKGETEGSNVGELHDHSYSVRFDEDGAFEGGETSESDGHKHVIKTGSVTEPAGEDGHTHRYNLMDVLFATNEAS